MGPSVFLEERLGHWLLVNWNLAFSMLLSWVCVCVSVCDPMNAVLVIVV